MENTMNKSAGAETDAQQQMMKLLSSRASPPKSDGRSSLENEENHDQPQKAAHVSIDEDVPMTFPQRVS
jgi:hypothetical protein